MYDQIIGKPKLYPTFASRNILTMSNQEVSMEYQKLFFNKILSDH